MVRKVLLAQRNNVAVGFFDQFTAVVHRDDFQGSKESAVLEVVGLVEGAAEQLHEDLAPCTDQEFFTAYEKAHAAKYGEEWELSKANPIW